MKQLFQVYDLEHSDAVGQFDTLDESIAMVRDLAVLPWDSEPNRCPCQQWKTCSRKYEIRVFDISENKWEFLRRTVPLLSVSSNETNWLVSGTLLEQILGKK